MEHCVCGNQLQPHGHSLWCPPVTVEDIPLAVTHPCREVRAPDICVREFVFDGGIVHTTRAGKRWTVYWGEEDPTVDHDAPIVGGY